MPRTVKKIPAFPLLHPPFGAILACPGITYTMGGIAIDGHARVLNEADLPIKRFRHVCWDGCMFPNAVMSDEKTWTDILGVMVRVRDAHGWREAE